jgi:hypothetical protein
LRERALARAVGAHDGVNFAGVDGQVDSLENLASGDVGMQVLDFE